MVDAFVGIDVAFAKRKRLPVCVCIKRDDQLVPLPLRRLSDLLPPQGRGNREALNNAAVVAFADEALEYLRQVEASEGVRITRVAIDAPSAPRRQNARRRAAESAMDERGISYIVTPSESDFQALVRRGCDHLASGGAEARLPGANQLWMLVGFALFSTLGAEYECIEVFPQAIAVALEAADVFKGKPEGLHAQLRAVSRQTGWPVPPDPGALREIGYGSPHDKLDAYLAAWVASLPEEQRVAYGNPPHDVIWIPSVGRPDAESSWVK